MPVVIFFACLDLEQKSSFMNGHKRISAVDISRYPPVFFIGLRFQIRPNKNNVRTTQTLPDLLERLSIPPA
jgi:hypothetical protein